VIQFPLELDSDDGTKEYDRAVQVARQWLDQTNGFHSRQLAVLSLSLAGHGAQRQQFASTCQRLKAAGRRGIELRPVELLLNAVKGFFADLAPRAQAVQCRALGGDRA
jgi:hypothetical protein